VRFLQLSNLYFFLFLEQEMAEYLHWYRFQVFIGTVLPKRTRTHSRRVARKADLSRGNDILFYGENQKIENKIVNFYTF